MLQKFEFCGKLYSYTRCEKNLVDLTYARGAGQPRSEICVTVMYVTEMIQLSE